MNMFLHKMKLITPDSLLSTNTVGDTGWQRCIGRLKLQVSFRKRATNYRLFCGERDL